MMVYLAGPIDMPHSAEDTKWWDTAQYSLVQNGIACYNPRSAWGGPRTVRDVNRLAIKWCDVMMVGFPSGNYGFETIREIEYARNLGKVVYAFGEKPDTIGVADIRWDSYANTLEAVIERGQQDS